MLAVPESLNEISEQEQPSTSASDNETTSAQDDAETVIIKNKNMNTGYKYSYIELHDQYNLLLYLFRKTTMEPVRQQSKMWQHHCLICAKKHI